MIMVLFKAVDELVKTHVAPLKSRVMTFVSLFLMCLSFPIIIPTHLYRTCWELWVRCAIYLTWVEQNLVLETMENLKPEEVLVISSTDMAKSKIRAASSYVVKWVWLMCLWFSGFILGLNHWVAFLSYTKWLSSSPAHLGTIIILCGTFFRLHFG